MQELISDRLKWLQDRINNPDSREEAYKQELQEYFRIHHPELYKGE